MKQTVIGLCLAVITLISANLSAQTEDNKWGVTVGADFVDFKATNGGSAFSPENWNKAVRLSINRYLFRHLNATGGVSLGSITNYGELTTANQTFTDAYLGLQYPIIRSITGRNTKIDPYLSGNGGLLKYAGDLRAVGGFGGGLNFWLKEDFAINIASEYNVLKNQTNYLQHTIGLSHIFGKPKDQDKDGIPDKDDACPAVAGPLYMQGCPDDDKDSIANSLDECPDLAGLREFNGCPDSDSDGVKDSEDDCPTTAGSKELKGCPDTDGDGIKDSEDACPTVSGSKDLNGCPDTDNDGIADKDDKCPNEPGGKDTGGCPVKETIAKNDNETADANAIPKNQVRFESNKYDIKPESFPTLDRLTDNLKNNPKNAVEIHGHADSSGNDAINIPLAKRRAEAVKAYLVGKGIKPNRITTKGFGSSKPIADNATPEGRAKNRRVEIILLTPDF